MAQDPKYYGGVLATSGAPAPTVGLNSDYALDLTSAGAPFIYLKTGNAWGPAISLKGAMGAAGNLVNVITKSSAYTVLPSDLTGNTNIFLLNNAALTVDAALLFNGTPTPATSLFIGVLRIDASPTSSSSIVAGGTSETINGTTSFPLPVQYTYREVFAASATALYTR